MSAPEENFDGICLEPIFDSDCHFLLDSDPNDFVCKMCGEPFDEADPKAIVRHVTASHICGTNQNQCAICGKGYIDKKGVVRHLLNFHLEYRPHKCDFCGIEFARGDRLRRHLAAIHKMGKQEKVPPRCELCGKQFSRKEHLRRHMGRKHKDGAEPAVSSSSTPKKPSTPKKTAASIAIVTKGSLKQFPPKSSSSSSSPSQSASSIQNCRVLLQPLTEETNTFHSSGKVSSKRQQTALSKGKTKVSCKKEEVAAVVEAVPKLLNTPSKKPVPMNGKSEIKTEMALDDYTECTLCKEFYLGQGHVAMMNHIHNRHAASKTDLKCDTCGKKFMDKRGLVRHILQFHLHYYPFYCSTCDKSFARRDRYITHMKTKHKGARIEEERRGDPTSKEEDSKTRKITKETVRIKDEEEEDDLDEPESDTKIELSDDDADLTDDSDEEIKLEHTTNQRTKDTKATKTKAKRKVPIALEEVDEFVSKRMKLEYELLDDDDDEEIEPNTKQRTRNKAMKTNSKEVDNKIGQNDRIILKLRHKTSKANGLKSNNNKQNKVEIEIDDTVETDSDNGDYDSKEVDLESNNTMSRLKAGKIGKESTTHTRANNRKHSRNETSDSDNMGSALHCVICNGVLESRSLLSKHLYSHHVSTSTCEVCGKQLADKKGLVRHLMNTHFKIKPYNCSSCDKSFTRGEHHRRHVILYHPDSEPPPLQRTSRYSEALAGSGSGGGYGSATPVVSSRVFRCDQCYAMFETSGERDAHQTVCLPPEAKVGVERILDKREINGKVHHIVKRAYEILIPINITDDENTAERKWHQEKDQEEAEEEREFENKYKNRTSKERFIKREEKRKAEFYKFFNEKWDELQKNRARRDVQRETINLEREQARNLERLKILGKSKNKAFAIKKRMKRSETIFKCPVCSKKFKTHMRLNKHILNDHKPGGTTKSQRFTLHKKDYDVKELGEEYQNFDELKTREYEDDIPLNVEIKNVNHTLIPYHLVKGREYTPDERMEESFEDLGLGSGPTPAGFAKIHQDLKRIQKEDEKYNNAYMKMLFVTEKERTEEVTQAYDDYNIQEKIDKLFPSPKSNMKCTECGATFGSEMEADVHNFDHRMMPHVEYELFPDKFTKLTTPKIEHLVLNHRALKKVATAGFWGYNKHRADRFNSSEEMRYKTMNWFEFDYNTTSEKPRRMIWNLRAYNRTLKTWEVIPNVTIPEVDRDPTVPKGKGTDYSEFSSYESVSVDMKKKKSLEEVAREYLDSENPPNETFFQQSYFDADRNSSQIYGSEEFNEDESSLMHSREFDDIPSVLLRSDAEKQEEKNKISHKKHEANKITGKQDKKQNSERHHKTKENVGPIDVYIKEREKEEMLERQKLENVRSKRRKGHHRNQNISAVLDQFLDAEVEEKPSDPNQSSDPEFPITSSLIQKYTGSSGSIYEHMNLTDYIKRKKISLLYDPDEVTDRNCTKPYKQHIRVSDYLRDEIETEKKNRKEGIRAILSKYNITKYPDLDEYYKDDEHLINTKHDHIDHHTTEKWHLTTKQIKSIEEIKRPASIEEIRRTDVSPVFGTRVVFQTRTVTFYGKGQYTYKGDQGNKMNKINKIDNFMDEFQNNKGVNVWDTHIRDNDDILKRFQKSKKAQEERMKISTTKKKIHTPTATPQYQDTREEVTLRPSAEMRVGIDRINEGLREKFAKTSSTTRKTRSTSISTTPSTIDYREQDARFNHASFNDDHETTTLDDRFFAHGSGYDDMADVAENRFGLPGGGGGGKRGGNIVDELKHVDRALKLEEKQEPSEQNSQFEDDDPKSWQFAGGTWGPNENMCDYEKIKKDMTDYFELYLRPRNITTVNYEGTDYCSFCNVTKMKNNIHVHDSQPECTEDHSAIVRNKSHTIFPLEFRLKKCNVCNKTFDIPIRDENYWNHVKSHNRPIISEKDFMYDAWNNYGQCSVCNKTFIPNDGQDWYLYHLYNHSEAGHICVNWTLDDYPYFSMPLNFTGDSYDSYDRYDDSALLFDMGGKNTKYSRYVTPGTVVTWYDERNEHND
uniref:Fez family zinc finger protein 2 n=1 Tax=Cacopsylla melanoneura TaxID=428564 RepID=A0A8D8M5K9_9HEMI